MSELRQKEPRIRDIKRLAWLRTLPCVVCGAINTEAAHIRTASLEHGKRGLGMQEKASDCWTVPLCNECHREQHSMNEMAFWALYGINPFLLALSLRVPE